MLDQIGRMYGRIMYLLDSYRDYASDRAHKRFNALARCFPQHDVQRHARQLFAEAHAAIERCVDQLTLPRLVRKLLLRQLKQIGTQTLDLPLEAAGPEGHVQAATPNRKRQDGSCWDRLDCNLCDCCDCCECCKCCHDHDTCNYCEGCDACNCCDCS